MQKNVLRILSYFLAVVALSLSVFPAQAVDTEYTSVESFWNWVAGSGDIAQGILSHIPIGSRDNVCAKSDDGYHHSNGFIKDGGNGYFLCVCRDCGREFRGYASDLSAAYDDYVKELPASGYNSAGKLIWQPTWSDVSGFRIGVWPSSVGSSVTYVNVSNYWPNKVPPSGSYIFDASPSSVSFSYNSSGSVYIKSYGFFFSSPSVLAPIDGFYFSDSPMFEISMVTNVAEPLSVSGSYEVVNNGVGLYGVAGQKFSLPYRSFSFESAKRCPYVDARYYLPIFEITPVSSILPTVNSIYNINTRPASITGGNYGIVGDNGQITRVEGNTIVNETNNTYYNPSTGTTVPIVNWSYDYSDRSYKVTLESGDTVTVTYGDENVTIQEGDTVYNVYYLVDGSGTEQPPEVCTHEWSETSRTDPTCTVAGQAVSTCSKCQEVKTEPVPALGHDWQVKQSVKTEYDDTGQLVQEGYTIFECSRCQEQYKSTDGTIPPGGGSGTDPGGDEDETLWDKLGKLLGTAVKGILELLGSAVDVMLGGLIDLVTNLFESLKQLVDLFGTVGEAFQVLWTWLPPEITAILAAGVSIFVFVALLKFFMK